LYVAKLNNFNPCENTHNDSRQPPKRSDILRCEQAAVLFRIRIFGFRSGRFM